MTHRGFVRRGGLQARQGRRIESTSHQGTTSVVDIKKSLLQPDPSGRGAKIGMAISGSTTTPAMASL